jgi:5-methylcytosine-specific restriction endonuclease McrA
MMAWANSRTGHGYKAGDTRLADWARGFNKPPTTNIIKAALLIGCTEEELAMVCYGVRSQAEALDAQRERVNKANRAKYQADENYRAQVNAKNKEMNEEIRAKRIAAIHADPNAFHYRVLIRYGLVDEADQQRNQRDARESRRQTDWRAEAARKRPIIIEGKRYSIRGVRQLLRHMNHRLNSMNRRLTRNRRSRLMFNGMRLKDAIKDGDPDAMDHLRKLWHVRSNNRRSLLLAASGTVILSEWYDKMKEYDYKCTYCGNHRRHDGFELEMDHVVPIPLGPNTIDNVLPACKTCNASKSQKPLIRWRPLTDDHVAMRVHAKVYPSCIMAYRIASSVVSQMVAI